MRITPAEVEITLSIFAVLLIPAIVLLVRIAIAWSRTDTAFKQSAKSIEKLVADNKEEHSKLSGAMNEIVQQQGDIHREIYEQMRHDRDATDRRLRFIEEYWMKRGQGN